MKKILFTLMLFFSAILTINAEKDWITYDWSIKQGPASNYLYYDETMETSDGYVTTSITPDYLGIMRKISKDGQTIIWEEKNDWGLYLSINQDENYYYGLVFANNGSYYGNIYICKILNDGTIDEWLYLETNDSVYDGEIYVNDGKIYVITYAYNEDTDSYGASNLYTTESLLQDYKVKKYSDLTTTELEFLDSITDNRTPLLSEEWKDIFPEEYDYIYISNQFYSGNALYAVGDVEQDGITHGFVLKIDMDKKVQWLKKSGEGYHYFDATASSGEYIGVVAYKDTAEIGYERNPNTVESYIYIYDKDGNLVETHDVASEIGTTRADVTHFLPFNGYILAQAFAYDENNEFSSYLIRYNVKYFIKTKIDGKGTIEVVDNELPGTDVTFKVTPQEGYILSEVRVTDAKGKVVTFTDYTFTMPNADVTIEAIFIKETPKEEQKEEKNPETSDIVIVMFIITTIISGVLLISNQKKYKWIK